MSIKSILPAAAGAALGFFTAGPGGALAGAAKGAAVGGAIGASIEGSQATAKAAQQASEIQTGAATEGITEQRRQFDAVMKLMAPYISGGEAALSTQQELLGLKGVAPQEAALKQIEASPFFSSLVRQGEEALLSKASATGGLRGGNIQGALAQFRPSVLNELVQQRLQNLGGLAQMGQASAAGQAAQGAQSAGAIGDLLALRGQALAGGAMAPAQSQQQLMQNLAGVAGIAGGLGFSPFGAAKSVVNPTATAGG